MKKLFILGLFTALLAQGAMQLSYSINGGATITCAVDPISSGPAACVGPIVDQGVTINVFASGTNSPGTPNIANQLTTSLSLRSTTSAIVEFWASSQDFTQPTAPPTLDYFSNLSTTSVLGSGTADLTSCLDTGNNLAPPFCTAGFSLTNVQQNWIAPTATSGTVSTTVANLSGPYSLSQHITIALNADSQMNVIASQVLTSPIPEPMSIVLLGTALIGLAVSFRRKLR